MGAHGGQKRVLDLLKLELQAVANPHMGACVCALVSMHGDQRLTSGVFLGFSPSYVLRYLSLELAR